MTSPRNTLVAALPIESAGLEAACALFAALVGRDPQTAALRGVAAVFRASHVAITHRPHGGATTIVASWPEGDLRVPALTDSGATVGDPSEALPVIEQNGDQLCLRWRDSDGGAGRMTILRGTGARFDGHDRALLLRLAPHVEQAVGLRRRVQAGYEAARAHASLLDASPMALAVVDRVGSLLFSNATAGAIFARDGCFAVNDRQLVLSAAADAAILLRALRAATGASTRRRRAAVISVPGVGPAVWTLHLQPLQSFALFRIPDARPDPLVLLRIVPARPIRFPDLAVLGRRYDLTAAELRVVAAAVAHRRAAAMARALGIAIVTVRFHLRNIYDKTGSRGVPALIALVHALAG